MIRNPNKNAILLAGRLLDELQKTCIFRITSVNGGGKANAIPRECRAVLVCEDADKTETEARAIFEKMRKEFCEADGEASLAAGKTDCPATAFTSEATSKLIDALLLVPNGINSFSQFDPEKLESSSSLGIIKTEGGKISLTVMPRSSSESRLDELSYKFDAFARAFGGSIVHEDRYPGWEFDPDSKLREIYKSACREITGLETEVVIAHGGLECGVIGKKLGEYDALSTSAHIMGAHTPRERVNIDSFSKTYAIVKRMLELM